MRIRLFHNSAVPSSTYSREVRILLFGEMWKRKCVHKNKIVVDTKSNGVVVYGIPNDCSDFGLKFLNKNYSFIQTVLGKIFKRQINIISYL